MAGLNAVMGTVTALIQRSPLRVLLLLIPVLVVAVVGAGRITFDDGHRTVFTSSQIEYRDYLAFARNFSRNDNNVAVLISGSELLTGDDITHIHDLALDIHLIDGVDSVFSLFSLQHFDPENGEMIPLVEPGVPETGIRAALETAREPSYSGWSAVSTDLRETVMVISFEDAMEDLTRAAPALSELSRIALHTREKSGLEVSVTGLLPIRTQVIEGIKADQQWVNLVGAGFGFLVSLLFFRNVRIALLNGVAPVVALLLYLGFLGLSGLSIDVVNNTLPVLILVLASSDCTHMTYEIRRQYRQSGDLSAAIGNAVGDLAPACILTSLTTALAFASLFYSDTGIVRNFALAGVVGVTIALVAILTVHPLVFALAARFGFLRSTMSGTIRTQSPAIWPSRMFKTLLARRHVISAAGIVLCLCLLIAFLPVRTSYQFNENIDPANALVKTMDRVEAIAGPISSIDIPFALAPDLEPVSPTVLEEAQKIHTALEEMEGVHSVVSLQTIVRFLKAHDRPVNTTTVSDVLDLLPERYLHRIIGRDGKTLLFSAAVGNVDSQALRRFSEAITMKLAGMDFRALTPSRPTGLLTMGAHISDTMIRQLVVSFLIAAGVCSLLIGIWFRRLDFAVAAILPNILPIAAVGAWMTISGANVQFTSALALTIAFGIAVDDTVHVFNRLSLENGHRRNRLSFRTVSAAMARVGPALTTTTCILSAGLFAVVMSGMPMVRYFGALCIFTFFLALLADLFLLPALVGMTASEDDQEEEP